MVILFDTCIILDHLLNREPFNKTSREVLKLSGQLRFDGLVTVKSIADIHYILKRSLHDEKRVRKVMHNLLQIVGVADSATIDMYSALSSNTNDFEDALLMETANRVHADYIVTRNLKDFKNSKVPAILPQKLIELIPEY